MNDCPLLPFRLPVVCDSLGTFLLYMVPVALVAAAWIVWTVVLMVRDRRNKAEDAVAAAEAEAALEWWNEDAPLKPRELATAERHHDRIVAHPKVVVVDTSTVELAEVLPPAELTPPEFIPAPVSLDLEAPADPIVPAEEATDD